MDRRILVSMNPTTTKETTMNNQAHKELKESVKNIMSEKIDTWQEMRDSRIFQFCDDHNVDECQVIDDEMKQIFWDYA